MRVWSGQVVLSAGWLDHRTQAHMLGAAAALLAKDLLASETGYSIMETNELEECTRRVVLRRFQAQKSAFERLEQLRDSPASASLSKEQKLDS